MVETALMIDRGSGYGARNESKEKEAKPPRGETKVEGAKNCATKRRRGPSSAHKTKEGIRAKGPVLARSEEEGVHRGETEEGA